MDRTFHRRVGMGGIVMVIIAAFLALFFFLSRKAETAILGFAMLALAAVAVERLIHTTYTLTADGRLVIYRGRFSRIVSVPISEIADVRKVNGRLLVASHVLVEYGGKKVVAIQPDDAQRFVAELQKRMET